MQKSRQNFQKEFDSKSVYNEKCLKTKIKSCNGKISKNLPNNKISKEGSQCICASVILIDSVYRKDKNYHPPAFSEECVVKEKKTSKFIIEISSDDYNKEDSDDSDKEDSDEENSNEENSNEEN